jgi:hypothetical protein
VEQKSLARFLKILYSRFSLSERKGAAKEAEKRAVLSLCLVLFLDMLCDFRHEFSLRSVAKIVPNPVARLWCTELLCLQTR